jgi:hypothetical protein
MGPSAAVPADAREALLDDRLWLALADGRPAREIAGEFGLVEPDAPGPLFPFESSRAIEVWTERDLSGLHALWWVAERSGDASLRRRTGSIAAWHVEHTQPDNATNRPWAIQVFVIRGLESGSSESLLYAETLLHNALVGVEGLDPLARLILDDAARALRGA